MSHFLSSTDFDFKDKTVLIRVDCDVDLREEGGILLVDDDYRLRSDLPTIKYVLDKGAKQVILMGHLGRPGGVVDSSLKLEPVGKAFNRLISPNFKFEILNFKSIFNFEITNLKNCYQVDEKVFLLENLRFDKREEENDEDFANELAGLGDVYINEDFSVSHREHASVVGIPKFLPGFLGLRLEKEIMELGKLRELSNEKRPLVFILGGSKKDKLDYLEFLGGWCDKVLIGGKLPLLITNNQIPNSKQILNFKFQISNLKSNKRDIDDRSISEAIKTIKTAGTIIWAGPMGVYEEKENEKGTFEVAKAITESSAFKVAGGGDTLRILNWLKIEDQFDFISVGGGAMLYFLKENTLPGIKAVNK